MLFFLLFTIPLADASHVISAKISPIQPTNKNAPQHLMSYIKGELNADTFSLFKNLTGLEIERSAIHDLKPETFLKTHLEILDVHNNIEFPTISTNTFRYLENLRVFRFNFNPYTDIEEGAFANLKNLDVLSISHISIPNLTKEFLEGLGNLRELALTNNEIEYIEKNALEELKELTAIFLGHNHLQIIEPGTFKQQKKLEDLQLQSNHLGNHKNSFFVKWEKFDSILTLKYLNIADNNLRYIAVDKLLIPFPLLESVNFMPNNLTCSHELYISKMLRHYRIDIEYYGNTQSSCSGIDFTRTGATVFSEPS